MLHLKRVEDLQLGRDVVSYFLSLLFLMLLVFLLPVKISSIVNLYAIAKCQRTIKNGENPVSLNFYSSYDLQNLALCTQFSMTGGMRCFTVIREAYL